MTAALASVSGSPVPADRWVTAAAAIRHAVLTTEGVAGLSEAAPFQTHGRGPAVRGLALTLTPTGGFRADLGVVVQAEVASDPDHLAGVVRSVRLAALAVWDRAGVTTEGVPGPLDLAVHLVDVASTSIPPPHGLV